MAIGIVGVRTTGIYCRDTCKARPLARNQQPFRSTLAAEAAGFRPCLRCRPDRLPPYAGDPATIVGRALSLIADGALDEGSEETLARRLGASARHLRRLFETHVGATPAHVARARRAHFARRLLDETDLRVEDVAFASGFSSVRQLNRVVGDIFRFTPRELRARRRDRDRLVADGGLALHIPYDGPLAFGALLAHRRPRAIPGVEAVGASAYRRTVNACGNPGVIEVSDAGDGEHLRVVAHLPSLGTVIDEVSRCRRMFGLDRPAAGSAAFADRGILADIIARAPGLRVPGPWDPFETSIRIILGQQVSVGGASTLAGRLAEAFGEPVAGLGPLGLRRLFPAADRLADASPERIRTIGLPAARAVALHEFARACAEGRLPLHAGTGPDGLCEALEALPGLGRWTAQMIALHAAGHPDAFPAGDLGLRRNAARLLGRDELPSEHELEQLAEAWRPYRALAAMVLWNA